MLLSYIRQLELLAFFSGYPFVYCLLRLIAGTPKRKPANWLCRLAGLLPYGYALTGTLFIGLVMKNIYPDYSYRNISDQFLDAPLRIWGSLAILFWIPAISKKPSFSLIHSMVFFILLFKDIILPLKSMSNDWIANDMKIYTISIVVNTATQILTAIFYFALVSIRSMRTIPG